jgi:hypothetical protein
MPVFRNALPGHCAALFLRGEPTSQKKADAITALGKGSAVLNCPEFILVHKVGRCRNSKVSIHVFLNSSPTKKRTSILDY